MQVIMTGQLGHVPTSEDQIFHVSSLQSLTTQLLPGQQIRQISQYIVGRGPNRVMADIEVQTASLPSQRLQKWVFQQPTYQNGNKSDTSQLWAASRHINMVKELLLLLVIIIIIIISIFTLF
jgi:hypothetical protein